MDDDVDTGHARGPDDRPRGVPKGKLNDINLDQKMSIFYRPDHHSAMIPVEASYPKEAATVFCDRIHVQLERSKGRSYVITGGDLVAYKLIFVWISNCIQTQSIEKFPDILEPEGDAFTPTINVILAGERLGIPAGSLSYHLKKRLNGCARKHLMPLQQVREFYDVHSALYPLGLKEVACSSVFNAWWDARLDGSVTPDLMEELADMRDDLTELDEDLHKACETREQEIKKKWAEKDARKSGAQRNSDGDGCNNSGTGDNNAAGGGADGWDDAGAGTVITGDWDGSAPGLTQDTSPTSGDWNNENANPATDDNWSQPQKGVANEFEDDGSRVETTNTWADEMNEPAHKAFHAVHAPQW